MSALEFTGEKYIPGQGGARMAYEHWHRYLFALRWARNKEVLDVASGVGYGAGLLAKVAQRVWALDIDRGAVLQGRARYRDANLMFLQGDAAALPVAAAAVDFVVALEVLEHLADYEGMVREVARVLRPQGAALISTPNKSAYSDARGYTNPFHVREFYRDEFLALLQKHFRQVELSHQMVLSGSLIAREDRSRVLQETFAQPVPEAGRAAAEPMYFLALCSNGAAQLSPVSESAYFDTTNALEMEWEFQLAGSVREVKRLNDEVRRLGQWGKELQGVIELRDRTIGGLQEEMDRTVAERDRTINALQGEMDRTVAECGTAMQALQQDMKREVELREQTIAGLQNELEGLRKDFDDRGRWALALEGEVQARDDRIRALMGELDQISGRLARIRQAFLYRVLRRLGVLPD